MKVVAKYYLPMTLPKKSKGRGFWEILKKLVIVLSFVFKLFPSCASKE